MKKRWIPVLLCLVVLAGCTNAPVDEGVLPSEPETVQEEGEEVTYITDAEITALIDAYLLYERYTVYASDSMQTAFEAVEINGNFFNKVTDPAYDTWDEWTAFAEGIFCGDALTAEMERLKNDQRFIDMDGYTYCQAGSMGWYISKEYTYRITEGTADRAVIEVVRQEGTPGEYETTDYIRNYVLYPTENGWRIGERMQ